MSIAYYNGRICAPEEIAVPLSDRAIFFGDGVYDAAIGRNGKIFLLDEHLDRFIGNCRRLGLNLPLERDALSALLLRLAGECGEACYMVYFQLSRFGAVRRHAYRATDGANLLITVRAIDMPSHEKRLKLVCYPDKRYGYCDIKTLNLLPSAMAASYAEALGADEAVFIRDGKVTECAHSNVSIIKDGVLYTHPKGEKILPGIMRAELIRACREMGVNCREEPFSRDALFAADEVIVTSSTKLFMLAESVDGVPLYRKESAARGAFDGKIGEKLTKSVNFNFVKSTK